MPKRGKVIPFPGPGARRPRPGRARGGRGDRGLVAIHRCDQAEAMVVRSLLESESIPALLRSRLVSSVHPFTVGAQGEVVIFVPDSEVPRARLLLARTIPDPPP